MVSNISYTRHELYRHDFLKAESDILKPDLRRNIHHCLAWSDYASPQIIYLKNSNVPLGTRRCWINTISTTLLRRWLNVNEADSQQRRVPCGRCWTPAFCSPDVDVCYVSAVPPWVQIVPTMTGSLQLYARHRERERCWPDAGIVPVQCLWCLPSVKSALGQRLLLNAMYSGSCSRNSGTPYMSKNEMNRALGHLCAHIG